MAETPKLSMFVMQHEQCDPSKWTISDFAALAEFAKTGDLRYATTLAKRGLKFVGADVLDHPDGTLQDIGWATENDLKEGTFAPDLDTAFEFNDDDEAPLALCRIYRSPTVWAVRYLIGDGEGNVDGHDYEIRETEQEASKLAQSIYAGETPS